MKTNPCPKCGSVEWEHGKIHEQGSLGTVRFKADAASVFSLRKKLAALACSKCGFVEFYLSDHDAG